MCYGGFVGSSPHGDRRKQRCSVLIYLASPYSHPDADVRQHRFERACQVAGGLMREGHHIFSPIAHTHSIAVQCDLPLGFDFWRQYDEEMIAACGELWVLMLPMWSQSKGVSAEIALAMLLGKPVRSVVIDEYTDASAGLRWTVKPTL